MSKMRSPAFRTIIYESNIVYPKVRKWGLVNNSIHIGNHIAGVREVSRTLAVTDGFLPKDTYPLMYTLATLRNYRLNPEHGEKLHSFLRREMSTGLRSYVTAAISEAPNISTTLEGWFIRGYARDADTLLKLGVYGHQQLLRQYQSNISAIDDIIDHYSRLHFSTATARKMAVSLHLELVQTHIAWKDCV
jgi:hypothetical protein